MSLLKYPLLLGLAKSITRGLSPLRWIDLYSAQYIADGHLSLTDNKDGNDQVVALGVLVSFVSGKGETYLDLENLPKEVQISRGYFRNSQSHIDQWLSKLAQSPAICNIADSSEVSSDTVGANDVSYYSEVFPLGEHVGLQEPLILWRKRLYLARYWYLHQGVERWIYEQSKAVRALDKGHVDELAKSLKQVFQLPTKSTEESKAETSDARVESSDSCVDWQAIAAAHTLLQNFSVITGGPGTGKTTTAASLLFLLMKRHHLVAQTTSGDSAVVENVSPQQRLSVRLLAPTGKAAVKLADSIRHHLVSIETRLSGADLTSIRMSDCLPESGETIHRFLYQHGALRESLNQTQRFTSDEVILGKKDSRQAQVDIVVIDEASMIDLALMVELIKVIPSKAQVILLGDHCQLPAVEPGQVFSDLVTRYKSTSYSPHFATSLSRLSGYHVDDLLEQTETRIRADFQPLCELRKTYRFGGDLKMAANQIKAGQSKAFKTQFKLDSSCESKAVRWHTLDQQVFDGRKEEAHRSPEGVMLKPYLKYFECVSSGGSLKELSAAFEAYQLLCSTHDGPLGVTNMNELIEAEFVYPHRKIRIFASGLYHGKAILVTRNHPHLGVYNGDIGFAIANQEGQANVEIHFPQQNDQAIIVAPGRIKEWQPAYAMTVHKSQGSEYEHVGIVLAGYAKELLSRALLYTALTRSKLCCDIWAQSSALDQAFEEN